MGNWLLEHIAEERVEVNRLINKFILSLELQNISIDIDFSKVERVVNILELHLFDLLSSSDSDKNEIKKISAELFRLCRILPQSEITLQHLLFTLKYSCFAVLGDIGISASKLLKQQSWDETLLSSENWKEKTLATIIDIWLRLIRKKGWEDRDRILENIAELRKSQKQYEKIFLEQSKQKHDGYELIILYHLAAAAEKMALYITDGKVDGNFQIQQILDSHFDRAINVCDEVQMLELEPVTRLLTHTSKQLVENAIWTVTRAVNSRVTKFVKELVDRGRGDNALFDVLPPQRHTLAEEGLLGSSRRAVVVSLPTSSGKTMIAQFRILQALNQFDTENGWVAYLAPTRALVNQITRRIRNDFEPLGISVEQVSPALEVDGFEMSILQNDDKNSQFKVLVTTPEKLDLMLRQDWESKIGRPLTLVVVDEAHNLQNATRGLKLELLLANINKECENAQFLLLTPFIENAKEIATWLGGANSDDINMSIDWQPNERAIGIVYAEKSDSRCTSHCRFNLKFKSVHTSKPSISIDENIMMLENNDQYTFSQVNDNAKLATMVVNQLKERDSVIAMHGQVRWVWSLAEEIKIKSNLVTPSENIKYVQKFLSYEFGSSFQLIDLLNYKIGVHHAGFSDEVRTLMEWLFEKGEINVLVATTTIAQGMNFPVGAVVMASHQYFSTHAEEMPPEDFWNIAGRAGRVGQDSIGIIALVAKNDTEIEKLRTFINKQTGALNSSLIEMVTEAMKSTNNMNIEDLGKIVYQQPTWSAFVQYLTHTYKQMGESENFIAQIEQVLRGTFGFEKLRQQNRAWSNKFIRGVENYATYMQDPKYKGAIKLVDSTGFSLQSVIQLLQDSGKEDIGKNSWNQELFGNTSVELQKMVGILLKIPELRDNFDDIKGKTNTQDGNTISLVIKDWVNGKSIENIAENYFKTGNINMDEAITKCGQSLYGKITQTASWGLSALLSPMASEMTEDEFKELSNLPARVYYGVNSDDAMMLRLIGVPRIASTELSKILPNIKNESVVNVRHVLKSNGQNIWKTAMGDEKGDVYYKVWSVLEGL
ncbi:MAG: DEAD/DEAH box helicase [Proteobacteria bacterium]|nr:MAG: DEAD/DEAH box helicase [Pseudomonadota bacterium]